MRDNTSYLYLHFTLVCVFYCPIKIQSPLFPHPFLSLKKATMGQCDGCNAEVCDGEFEECILCDLEFCSVCCASGRCNSCTTSPLLYVLKEEVFTEWLFEQVRVIKPSIQKELREECTKEMLARNRKKEQELDESDPSSSSSESESEEEQENVESESESEEQEEPETGKKRKSVDAEEQTETKRAKSTEK